MVTYQELMAKLGEQDQIELKKFVHFLSDDLSRNILLKLASPHSPIGSEDLPLKELGKHSKNAALHELNDMEKCKVVESEMKKLNGRYHRVYDLTDEGKIFVREFVPAELIPA